MVDTVCLVNAREPYFREGFEKACQEQGVTCKLISTLNSFFFIKDGYVFFIHNGEDIDVTNCYFFIRMRDMDSFFSTLLAQHLTNYGAQFNDPINVQSSSNYGKISQLIRLTPQGFRFPDSMVCRRHAYQLHRDFIHEVIGFPCVFKRAGSRGEAVWKIDTEKELLEKFDDRPFEASIIQRYIPNEFDMRVMVFQDEIIGAMRRTATDGFANAGYDAVLEPVSITDEEKKLAIDATAATGLHLAGVDIVRTDDGPLLWEVNMCPQLDRFMPATGIDAIGDIVKVIKTQYLDDGE